jgi:hypothetical protein
MKLRVAIAPIILALFLGVPLAFTQAQNFPQTMPPNTVFGRLGVSAGPGQAIPFSYLTPLLLTSTPPTGTTGLSILETTDTSWMAFGVPVIIAATHGGFQNAIVGYALNDSPMPILAFPTGTTGYGKVTTQGNTAFGIFGLGEIAVAGGGAGIASEFTCRNNSGQPPTTHLPPNQGIGSTDVVCNAVQVTAGGSNNPSIGVVLSNEGGSPAVFNTGMYFSPQSFAQYGLFIDSQSSGASATSVVIQNNGNGINLQLGTTGPIIPNGTMIAAFDAVGAGRFSVRQSGVVNIVEATAPPANGAVAMTISNTANFGIFFSNGTPSVTAADGSINLDSTGKLWVHTGGAWVQVTVP